MAVHEELVGEYLNLLADRVPAPGGGAAAALVAMVARYSDGDKHAEHAETIAGILQSAERLRHEALTLAEQDARAFASVAEAYRRPRSTEDEKAARGTAIQDALASATRPPAATISIAASIVDLAERPLPIGNRNVITDVAEAARAAAATSRVNVEINLSGLKDPAIRQGIERAASGVDDVLTRADKVTAAVREWIR